MIGPDFQALGQQYGHFIEGNFIVQEMPFVRTNATVVTIFAGGNEINTITSALGGQIDSMKEMGLKVGDRVKVAVKAVNVLLLKE